VKLDENTRAEDQKALLRQVVSLDMLRILSRLRSRHATRYQKAAGKPAVIGQLSRVFRDKSVTARPGFSEPSLIDARNTVQNLQDLFARLEDISDMSTGDAEMREILEQIVQRSHELTAATDLSLALRGFSGDPSLKRHLPEAIGKLGRYYSVSSELVCAARDRTCGIFHSIQVEPYKIDVPSATMGALGRFGSGITQEM
jgi:hypothetical protein